MIVVGGDENIALVSSNGREAYPVSPNFLLQPILYFPLNHMFPNQSLVGPW